MHDVDTGNMDSTARAVDTVNMVEVPDTARRYHHGNLRAALIDTAVDQARAGGADAVVLRDAARRAGVSHNAAYRHFADRDDLLAEVSARGMAELERRMRERLADLPDDGRGTHASARLREAGREYVHFALAEPGLFATAFACARPEEGAPGQGAYGVLSTVLDDLVTAGVLPAERRPGADVTCWAAVHGFALLCLQGPLRDLPAREREAQLDGLLVRLARGL
jgi:AcrR family transcriptional regulator